MTEKAILAPYHWQNVSLTLPEIGEEVLCYYEIKRDGEVFKYRCVGKIESIVNRKTIDGEYTEVEWIDKDRNPIEPLYWMRLTYPTD